MLTRLLLKLIPLLLFTIMVLILIARTWYT